MKSSEARSVTAYANSVAAGSADAPGGQIASLLRSRTPCLLKQTLREMLWDPTSSGNQTAAERPQIARASIEACEHVRSAARSPLIII